MNYAIEITRDNLDQLAKSFAASINRLGFRKDGKEMVPSQAVRILAERLGMNEHKLVKSLSPRKKASQELAPPRWVAFPNAVNTSSSRTERSFELGALGKDELLDVVADHGAYQADMENQGAEELRSVILELEFPNEGPQLPMAERVALLNQHGYVFSQDSDQPGLWVWVKGDEGCDMSFESLPAALSDAWMQLVQVACEENGLSVSDWNTLDVAQQKALLHREASSVDGTADSAINALQNTWGEEHPWYGRDEWRQDVADGNTKRGYWDWVMACVESNGGDDCHCTRCGQPSSNGEGWDGLCGDCADRQENESEQARQLADLAFEAADFGDDYVVADHNGWEWSTGDTIWRKTVFLEELGSPEKPTVKVTFVVDVADNRIGDTSIIR